MLLVLIIIFAFSCTLLVLNITQKNMWLPENDYESFEKDRFQASFIDYAFSQYLLMLGEFEIIEYEGMENYGYYYQVMIFVLFFGATFLTNVVFFNQLVSVIGENYGELWKNRFKYGLVEQTKLIGDFTHLLKERIPKDKFMYVVMPI